jgi:hypothetical protein
MYARLCTDVGEKPLDQSGLANAGLPHNGDDPPPAVSGRCKCFLQALQLFFAFQ